MSLSHFLAVAKPAISRLVSRRALSTSASSADIYGMTYPDVSGETNHANLFVPLPALLSVPGGAGVLQKLKTASALNPPNSREFATFYVGNKHYDETEVSLLMKDIEKDEVMALKKGPPLHNPDEDFNPEDVWVMTPFGDWKPPVPPNELLDTANYKIFEELWKLGSNTVMTPFGDWKPPVPPNELLDTANYKIFEELWKLGSNTVRILTKAERRLNANTIAINPIPRLPETVEQMVRSAKPDPGRQLQLLLRRNDYENYLDDFSWAIMFGWQNFRGRAGLHTFLNCVGEVCEEKLQRSGKKSDIKHRVYNLGGQSRGGDYNINYAFRACDLTGLDMESDVDKLRAACGKQDMWSVYRHPEHVGDFMFSRKAPDVATVIQKQQYLEEGYRLSVDDGLLVGEVKSDAQMYGDKWQAGINQAVVQAMKGMVNQDHSAAVVISPKDAVFMTFDLQDGCIKTKQKKYTLGDGREVMFADACAELFHDLVGYLWDRYYSCL